MPPLVQPEPAIDGRAIQRRDAIENFRYLIHSIQ
jgi:hypothetical protein